jgi:hypothetical protein
MDWPRLAKQGHRFATWRRYWLFLSLASHLDTAQRRIWSAALPEIAAPRHCWNAGTAIIGRSAAGAAILDEIIGDCRAAKAKFHLSLSRSKPCSGCLLRPFALRGQAYVGRRL